MCCGFYLLGDVQVAGVRLISRVFGYCALLPVEMRFVCGCLILVQRLRRDCWWSCSYLELICVEVSVGRLVGYRNEDVMVAGGSLTALSGSRYGANVEMCINI